jgi:hypothetical protein
MCQLAAGRRGGGGDQEVRRLEVAVHNVGGVQVLQATEHLRGGEAKASLIFSRRRGQGESYLQ